MTANVVPVGRQYRSDSGWRCDCPGRSSRAARDLHTTQGLCIAKGARGIVAEDRGSKLVVFFDEQDSAVGLTEP